MQRNLTPERVRERIRELAREIRAIRAAREDQAALAAELEAAEEAWAKERYAAALAAAGPLPPEARRDLWYRIRYGEQAMEEIRAARAVAVSTWKG